MRAAITALEPPGLSHEVERVRVEGPRLPLLTLACKRVGPLPSPSALSRSI